MKEFFEKLIRGDFDECLDNASLLIKQKAEAEGIDITRDAGEPVTEPIERDNRRLTELFHNRLTNRGKQVLTDAAIRELEEQENEK